MTDREILIQIAKNQVILSKMIKKLDYKITQMMGENCENHEKHEKCAKLRGHLHHHGMDNHHHHPGMKCCKDKHKEEEPEVSNLSTGEKLSALGFDLNQFSAMQQNLINQSQLEGR